MNNELTNKIKEIVMDELSKVTNFGKWLSETDNKVMIKEAKTILNREFENRKEEVKRSENNLSIFNPIMKMISNEEFTQVITFMSNFATEEEKDLLLLLGEDSKQLLKDKKSKELISFQDSRDTFGKTFIKLISANNEVYLVKVVRTSNNERDYTIWK